MTYTATTPLVLQVCTLFDLRPDILAAQIEAESSGDPFAFRYEPEFYERYIDNHPHALGYRFGPLAACSYGLLQVLLETAVEHGFDGPAQQLFDPRVGLTFGAKYLKHCLTLAAGDYRLALEKYNGTGVRATAYAARVLAIRDRQGDA